MSNKRGAKAVVAAPVTESTPVVEQPTVLALMPTPEVEANGHGTPDNAEVNGVSNGVEEQSKAELIRQQAKQLANGTGAKVSPTGVLKALQKQGVPWLKTDEDVRKHTGYVANILQRDQERAKMDAETDLDVILERLATVKAFVEGKCSGSKLQLEQYIAVAEEIEQLARQVGGMVNLKKFAAKC